MTTPNAAIMTEKDWENLRSQLRVLVDIYCDANEEILKIKMLLKRIVKVLLKTHSKKEKKCPLILKPISKKSKKKSTPSSPE